MPQEQNEIDLYISTFPEEVQEKLNEIRKLIKSLVPDATEKMSYQMPTFYLDGNLVHFAGYKNHIGFYPTPSGITAFEDELKKYKYAKGSARFPLDEPLPIELITKIVQYRLEETAEKNKKKVKKETKK